MIMIWGFGTLTVSRSKFRLVVMATNFLPSICVVFFDFSG